MIDPELISAIHTAVKEETKDLREITKGLREGLKETNKRLDRMEAKQDKMIVIHANNEEAAKEWQAKLAKKYPNNSIEVSYFGPVIGTHLGENALALGWMEDIDK
ncbi:DegV family protein [uncultured Ligilactobacillus sp.]|uniref:DegV family protein n=1 Tax=uncultured Ligilactobacillus sp. TaxID=2837633 RepID=UPI002729CD92|nr:DegV family protein [uncultured Ligilactobacillus sp.]